MKKTQEESVTYCGLSVSLLSVESNEYGNLALIEFEDGRQDYVPLSTVIF